MRRAAHRRSGDLRERNDEGRLTRGEFGRAVAESCVPADEDGAGAMREAEWAARLFHDA
jgi:hypothetical protein